MPEAVTKAVLARTGGQPYPTQLFGHWLIDTLNESKRRTALPEDIDAVEELVCDKAGGYFRESLNPRGAEFGVRATIEAIVTGGAAAELSGEQKRFLVGRRLLTGEGKLAFPVPARRLQDFT